MHNQSPFKVTWTPYDHRMITWLTSESLPTQAPGHLVTTHRFGVITRLPKQFNLSASKLLLAIYVDLRVT